MSSPEEGEEGLSLYESWHKRDNWTDDRDAPRSDPLPTTLDLSLWSHALLLIDFIYIFVI